MNLSPDYPQAYVLCDDVNFDYAQYIAQTPNSKIGSNSDVIFNMWYYPNPDTKITGVQWPTPLFYQYYYKNGVRENSSKCTLMTTISGYYCYKQQNDDPTTFLNNMTAKYWNDVTGMSWSSFMTAQTKSSIDLIKDEVKKSLNSNKPITVGASNGKIDHMVLVVGYKNSGSNMSDYIVLDSCQENLSDLDAFFKTYPKVVITWGSTKGGYMYGTFY